jgi:hypothetical protein
MRVIAPAPDKFTSEEHHRFHAAAAGIVTDVTSSGTTANRPARGLYVGKFYFDTTIGKPIWYEGPSWVDATGTVA